MISDETREKLSRAKRGHKYTPEHRAAISAGVRKALEEGRGSPGSKRYQETMAQLTEKQRGEYKELIKRSAKFTYYSRSEALTALGREDLI